MPNMCDNVSHSQRLSLTVCCIITLALASYVLIFRPVCSGMIPADHELKGDNYEHHTIQNPGIGSMVAV